MAAGRGNPPPLEGLVVARLTEGMGYLDEYLDAPRQADFGPNGLQVEGRPEVTKVLLGVTVCRELIEAAAAGGYDLVLVHHGLFWSGWEPRITGVMKSRVAALLGGGISLAAFHLPLDRHPVVGNNAQIADRLGLTGRRGIAPYRGEAVGLAGDLPAPMPAAELEARLTSLFGPLRTSFRFGPEAVRTIGVLSGKGDHDLKHAIASGCDAYLTGEAGVSTREEAREAGVHDFAAGHHATERFGVQALGPLLEARFGLPFRFHEVENPV
jgi:dinuclear metal center YbgI/SA1388 family protein